MSHGADSVKSILFALGANLAIAVAKGMAAAVTGSGAMLAESIHSVADSGNQLLLLLGLKQARRPASEEYPLGYGKAVFFWSFIVALILFSVGGMFAIYEGLHKFAHPEPLTSPAWAISVLVFAIVAEGISMRVVVLEINKIRDGRSLFRWFRETRQSELLVVFGEDLAALLGLIIALFAVLATVLSGNPLFDAGGTVMIGILLIVVAFFIGAEVKDLLIGQSVEPKTRAAMNRFLAEQPAIAEVFSLLTMHFGQDVMVAVKARMEPTGSETGLLEAVNRVEREFRETFPEVTWLFFEPDLHDD